MLLDRPVFKGSATAIITPFSGGKIDFVSFGRLIERQLVEGADGIVVCGTTGESATLSETERRDIIRFAVKQADGRLPVIAGTGCNNISTAIEMTKFAEDAGADAVMTVTPYYNKASESGLIRSFTAIADSVKLPVILYNVPSRTGIDIPMSVYKELCRHERICAVKEAGGNILTTQRILTECRGMLDVYSGNDDMTLAVLALGGIGVVSVVGNLVPHKMHGLCTAFFEGSLDKCRQLQQDMSALCEAMFCEVNPIPVKCALAMMGLCGEEMRLPLCEIDSAKRSRIAEVLRSCGLIG